MKIKNAFVNESKQQKELLHYDVDPSKVSLLMQQEGIDINSGGLKRVKDVELFNNFTHVFYAGKDTETLVFYNAKDFQIALMANEFSEMIFMYQPLVYNIQSIKPIINEILRPNKNWDVYEIQ